MEEIQIIPTLVYLHLCFILPSSGKLSAHKYEQQEEAEVLEDIWLFSTPVSVIILLLPVAFLCEGIKIHKTKMRGKKKKEEKEKKNRKKK